MWNQLQNKTLFIGFKSRSSMKYLLKQQYSMDSVAQGCNVFKDYDY